MPVYPYKYIVDGVEHEGTHEAKDRAAVEKQIKLDIVGSAEELPEGITIEVGKALRGAVKEQENV